MSSKHNLSETNKYFNIDIIKCNAYGSSEPKIVNPLKFTTKTNIFVTPNDLLIIFDSSIGSRLNKLKVNCRSVHCLQVRFCQLFVKRSFCDFVK